MKMSYKIALLVSLAVFVLAVVMMTRTGEEGAGDTLADASPEAAQPQASERKSLLGEPTEDGSVKALTSNTAKPKPQPARSNLAQDVRKHIDAANAEPPAPATDTVAANTDTTTTTPPAKNPTDPAANGAIPLTQTDDGVSRQTPPSNPKPAVSTQDLDAILGGTAEAKPADTQASAKPKTTPVPTQADGRTAIGTGTDVKPGDTYVVQPKDTLSSIAEKLYGDERRWADIAQANPTVDPKKLQLGQVLRLPDESQSQLSEEEPVAKGPQADDVYKIRPGDSLSTVAEKYYGDPTLWRTIYNYNRDTIGDNPNAIQAGMPLKIPKRITSAQ